MDDHLARLDTSDRSKLNDSAYGAGDCVLDGVSEAAGVAIGDGEESLGAAVSEHLEEGEGEKEFREGERSLIHNDYATLGERGVKDEEEVSI